MRIMCDHNLASQMPFVTLHYIGDDNNQGLRRRHQGRDGASRSGKFADRLQMENDGSAMWLTKIA
jgi:hypothetical protein